MPDKDRLFLSIDEALEAVRIAFANYPFQWNLFAVIWPMVFGDGAYILKDDHTSVIWAKIPGKPKLIPSSENELKRWIADRLKQSPTDPQHLARICALVFGASVKAGSGPEPDRSPGVWIDTDMGGFVCVQCGHCCRTLNYHDGCTLADYKHWQDLGRTDILDWVGIVRHAGRVTACRIWMMPGTNQYAPTCPWLKKLPDRDRYACTIYSIRPTICRQYPGSRKHARMTGCRGG
jgi:Fe-S-cluster containining protein